MGFHFYAKKNNLKVQYKARSINSKMYNRFLASFIPESLTRNKRFITVKIDMTRNGGGNHIFFREAGTIDAY